MFSTLSPYVLGLIAGAYYLSSKMNPILLRENIIPAILFFSSTFFTNSSTFMQRYHVVLAYGLFSTELESQNIFSSDDSWGIFSFFASRSRLRHSIDPLVPPHL